MLKTLPIRKLGAGALQDCNYYDKFEPISCNGGSSSFCERTMAGTALHYQSSESVDVLGTEDIVFGVGIALLLAFTASYLQGQRAQNDFVLWEKTPSDNGNVTVGNGNRTASRIFDGEAWKEISRPDNYVYFNRKIIKGNSEDKGNVTTVERRWVLVALLALFVPIFSVEFFFALSRQVICDLSDPISRSDLSEFLCSPVAFGDPL